MTKEKYLSLSDSQLKEFQTIIQNNQYGFHSKYQKVNELLGHYKKYREENIKEDFNN